MGFVGYHSLKDVALSVAGTSINGFGSDGGVAFEFASDLISDDAGAAGEVTVSEMNDDRVYVDVTVKQGSRAAAFLGQQLNLQKQAIGAAPLSFFCRNIHTGEVVRSKDAVFKTRPSPDQEQEAGERTFRLLLPHAASSIVYGEAGL